MTTLPSNEMLKPADSRLVVSEVEEWGTHIEEIARLLKASCTVDVKAIWPTYRRRFLTEKIRFERECTEPLANVTPKATHLDTYGFKGYSGSNNGFTIPICRLRQAAGYHCDRRKVMVKVAHQA